VRFEHRSSAGALSAFSPTVFGSSGGTRSWKAAWRPATQPVVADLSNELSRRDRSQLALPALEKGRAAQLAEARGLVTHLTSLDVGR